MQYKIISYQKGDKTWFEILGRRNWFSGFNYYYGTFQDFDRTVEVLNTLRNEKLVKKVVNI